MSLSSLSLKDGDFLVKEGWLYNKTYKLEREVSERRTVQEKIPVDELGITST